jgi:hypothetical protein
VRYGAGAAAFAGATYDPTSHYRGAAVLDFFDAQLDEAMAILDEAARQEAGEPTALAAARAYHYVAPLPPPPEPYVAHPYTLLQTPRLIGRREELNLLTGWATGRGPAGPARLLCVEAVGGLGKSALTWQWFDEIAPQEMKPLAGRFWWSFYESDATFENFVTRALAYVARWPLAEVSKLPSPEREDGLTPAIELFHALIGLGRYEDALSLFQDRLEEATLYRLGAARQRVKLMERCFPSWIEALPCLSRPRDQSYVRTGLAIGYRFCGSAGAATEAVHRAEALDRGERDRQNLGVDLCNLSDRLRLRGACRLARARLCSIARCGPSSNGRTHKARAWSPASLPRPASGRATPWQPGRWPNVPGSWRESIAWSAT